jgi:hypothetical protein
MSIFKKIFGRIIPQDTSDDCGVGPFKLPHNHPFTRACQLHDYEFVESHRSGKRLSEVDWDLFYRWVLIAAAEPEPLKRCRLAEDICQYWPIARRFGGWFWDGN